MSTNNDVKRAAEKILEDESLLSNLKDDEAKALIDWALAELEAGSSGEINSLDLKVEHVRNAMKEINNLVGNKQNLVADDLEERMANLLVADLDPKAAVRLEIERAIAQVTAEKDHLEGAALVQGLAQIASKTWRARTQSTAQTLAASNTSPTDKAAPSNAVATTVDAARKRPIPRPTPIAAKKSGWVGRWLGRK